MPILLQTTLLLICSNVFMTFAWYAHLKDMGGRPWLIAALVSWGVALAEYLLQVPANRIGYTTMNLGQLKILQEVIALSVFVPFAVLSMEAAAEAQLSVGGPMHLRSRVLRVPGIVTVMLQGRWSATDARPRGAPRPGQSTPMNGKNPPPARRRDVSPSRSRHMRSGSPKTSVPRSRSATQPAACLAAASSVNTLSM